MLGINEAFCKHCHTTRDEMCNLENIKKGFFKTRSSQQIIDKFQELMEGQPGNADIKLIYKDSNEREGITHEPMCSG